MPAFSFSDLLIPCFSSIFLITQSLNGRRFQHLFSKIDQATIEIIILTINALMPISISSIFFLLSIHQMLFLSRNTSDLFIVVLCFFYPFYCIFILNSSDVFILYVFILKNNTVILLNLSNIFCVFFLFNNSY